MKTLDELKAARDGHLRHGRKRRPPRPLFAATRDPITGHTFRTVEGMGTVEYAPKDCGCTECARRREWAK